MTDGNNEQLLRELAEADADELVGMLGLTTEEIIAAFPEHVDAYIVAMAMSELGWADDEDDEFLDLDDFDTIEDEDAPF